MANITGSLGGKAPGAFFAMCSQNNQTSLSFSCAHCYTEPGFFLILPLPLATILANSNGTLGGNRTPDALLRTETLYPLSYQGAQTL